MKYIYSIGFNKSLQAALFQTPNLKERLTCLIRNFKYVIEPSVSLDDSTRFQWMGFVSLGLRLCFFSSSFPQTANPPF